MSDQTIKILFLGDVFGEPGRVAVKKAVPELREKENLDLVLVNCENAARGRGITSKQVKELLGCGIDFMTSGNHILAVHEVYPYLNQPDTRVLRPHNFLKQSPGKGVAIVESRSGIKVGLMNIIGRLFMPGEYETPFEAADDAYQILKEEADIIVLDMHAETTSEKRAMGWHMDGRAQLIVGTHTHVPTADEEILPQGSAYITDLGMCGPYDSVIGVQKEIILKRYRTGIPQKFEVAQGDVRVCGVICEIDVYAKKALKIERVCIKS